jgi:uracil-DNA glycosylase
MIRQLLQVNCGRMNCPQYATCQRIVTEVLKYDESKPVMVLFVGQGGGEEEAKLGRPFVGISGLRLRGLIENILFPELGEFNYALSNTVRFRPSGNREPIPEEVDYCINFLIRDAVYLKPKAVVALGKSAMKDITTMTSPPSMGEVHGRKMNLDSRFTVHPILDMVYVTTTYHPSSMIRKKPRANYQRDLLVDYERAFVEDMKRLPIWCV